ncbi:aminopeptidase P family protein [Candidatus Woesearchaeota archaeon]|nr:aminopeptidase P family protein [Candidatus Woesearchaeota archaeon]
MKIKELQKILRRKKIVFALFINSDLNKRDKSVFYFTGVDPEFAGLVVPSKKSPYLIVAKLDFEKSKKDSKVRVITLKKNLFKQVRMDFGNIKRIGVDFTKLTIAEKRLLKKSFKSAKFIDISKDIIELRAQKTNKEIEKVRRACRITDKIFNNLLLNFKFEKESGVADFIENEAKRQGCNLSFPTIVASAKNSSMPHYKNNNSKLIKGFCVIDFGVNFEGYCSDMTRTIYIGNPSAKEKEDYYKVLGVQEEAIKQLKKGVDFREVDDAARKVLGDAYIHGLGHGLGIDVHEPIAAIPKKVTLKKGNILTVEPGIYYPGKYGIRIEDDVLVRENDCEVLTKSQKSLVVVKK